MSETASIDKETLQETVAAIKYLLEVYHKYTNNNNHYVTNLIIRLEGSLK